jgi:molecular chaperone GrpE
MSEEIKKENVSTKDVEQNEDVSIEKMKQDTTDVEQNKEQTKHTEPTESDYSNLEDDFKAEMEEKVKVAEDKYLRAYAEFENIKKRLEREKYQAIDYSSEKFAKDLLAPIDALQMAVLSTQGELPPETIVEKLKEGIELTLKSFNTAFEKHDIFEVEYDEYNPEFHNAVMKVNSDDIESGQIVTVMQKGYKLKERLLREAMVSVAN